MDRQAPVNGSKSGGSATEALARNAAGVTHDLVTIAELQMQLLLAELGRLARGTLWGLAFLLLATALLIALLPTLLAGLGLWLASVTLQTPAAGLLWVALTAGLLMAVSIALGCWKLRAQLEGLQRSRKEFEANLALLKRILSNYSNRPQDSQESVSP
jgi:hypothetical protein